MPSNNDFTAFEVSFILDQRGDYIEWIAEVLTSGMRDGEAIINLQIREIPQHELTEN